MTTFWIVAIVLGTLWVFWPRKDNRNWVGHLYNPSFYKFHKEFNPYAVNCLIPGYYILPKDIAVKLLSYRRWFSFYLAIGQYGAKITNAIMFKPSQSKMERIALYAAMGAKHVSSVFDEFPDKDKLRNGDVVVHIDNIGTVKPENITLFVPINN